MRRLWAALLVLTLAGLGGAAATKKKRVPPKKAAPRITAAQRNAARNEISRRIQAVDIGIENAGTLVPFREATLAEGQPIHILQFGDSHTASDDWVNSMRSLLQTRFGFGGPGFVQAGRPYKGYRRFDARGQNSPGWRTEGTLAFVGDAIQGLSGISLSTESQGQTVSLWAVGEQLNIFYLRQPGGGSLELTADGQPMGVFTTDGELGPGFSEYTLPPGSHDLLLRTVDRAPVRLYGWTLDQPQGLTFETLGINGAQASQILNWNEAIWGAEMSARNPALVILAYGTNEANSRRWTLEHYQADLTRVIARVRRNAPHAAILLVGPPDCGKLQPLLHLSEVVRAQRELALEQGVAFWDWRLHMGGPGAMRLWVTSGYAQADHIHMTGEGYRMVGEMIVDALLEKRQDEQARENR